MKEGANYPSHQALTIASPKFWGFGISYRQSRPQVSTHRSLPKDTGTQAPNSHRKKQTDTTHPWHSHLPTREAPDPPATEVLHCFRVHSRLTGCIGGPPEKQAT